MMDLLDFINLPNTKVLDVTKSKNGTDKDRKLRHLPIFGRPTYIVYKPHRYLCEDCDGEPTTTATPSWHKKIAATPLTTRHTF